MLEAIFYGTFIHDKKLTGKRALYLGFVWIVIPLFIVHALLNMFVGALFQLALGSYSEVANISYRQPYYTWTGDLGVRDLRITPLEDASTFSPMTAKDVRIDMPSWGVLMQVAGALDSGNPGDEEREASSMEFINKIDHVGIHLQGLKTEFDDGLPDVLSNFGLSSAAPFEAEGCTSHGYWSGSEVAGMGIADQGVDLNFTLSTLEENGRITLKGTMKAPAASKVDFEQHYKARTLTDFIESEENNRIHTYQRIEIRDAGFTKARNAFCAKRDGIAEAEFVERHVQSIQRLLLMQGFHAGPAVERVYRAYLKNGYLKVEAKPNINISQDDYREYAAADQFKLYNAQISSSGLPPVTLQMDVLPAKTIPYSFEGSTWDWLAIEAANPEAGLDNKSGARRASLNGRGSLFDPAAPAPVVQAEVVSEVVEVEDNTIAFSEASRHIGDRVVVTTIHGDKRYGDIESAKGKELGLRVYVAGGYAIQHIERGLIRSIEKQ